MTIEQDQPFRKIRYALCLVAPGDDEAGLAIGDHRGQPLTGIGRVERDIGAAGLEHGNDPDHQIQRTVQTEADPIIRSHTLRQQISRQRSRSPVKFLIGHLPLLGHHRRGLRPCLHLGGDQVVDAACPGLVGRESSVPLDQLFSFVIRQQREV